jgi:hypothetical protein
VGKLLRRIIVVGALPVAVAIAVPSPSGATTKSSASPVNGPALQAFTGSGTGTGSFGVAVIDDVLFSGHYSSTGQLGSGTFDFRVGLDPFARFTRSDGARLSGNAVVDTPGVCGAPDPELYCFRVAVTGSTDLEAARVQVTARLHEGVSTLTFSGAVAVSHRIGYSMLLGNARVDAFGGLDHLGDAPTTNAVDIERTPDAGGYWIVNAAGQVYAFGDAPYLGNAAADALAPGERVTSMTATPTGRGYWLFTSRGAALTFGDAHSYGDLRSVTLNGGIVGSVATPTGHGYYMVGTDGGVFAFGDARFRGSMGGVRLNQPVVGLVPTPDNDGYWLVASDGGVFSFDAPFSGSMGGVHLNRPVVAMVGYGSAYVMIASDGGTFDFSSLPFFGSDGGTALPAPVVNGAAAS